MRLISPEILRSAIENPPSFLSSLKFDITRRPILTLDITIHLFQTYKMASLRSKMVFRRRPLAAGPTSCGYFDRLPLEIVFHIFNKLDLTEIGMAALVSLNFNNLITDRFKKLSKFHLKNFNFGQPLVQVQPVRDSSCKVFKRTPNALKVKSNG